VEDLLVIDAAGQPRLAGVMPRLGAVLLDGLVPSLLLIPAAIVGWIVSLSLPSMPSDTLQIVAIFVVLLTSVALMSYSALVLALWASGRTPGKWMLGIQVIKRDTGRPAGFWRMALRQIVGQWVSAILCYIGFLWALFDANRQTWHDKIAKTLVIRIR
jgi:uncharacterized RDD family membrane protein YckC